MNRPFAGPGDFVEMRLSPVCDGVSPGFAEFASDHVVTVAFTPPEGPASLLILAPDCSAVESERQACEAQDSVAQVICRNSANEVDIFTRGEIRGLRFLFPDTDALVGAPNDARTLTGPVTIAVARVGAPLSCGLAARPCAAQSGLVACVDALFSIDGTCDPNSHEQFTHFTALPPPNDAKALCVEPSSLCTGRATEMRMTVDAAGNLLVPMSWQGVILQRALGIARLLNASAAAVAFPAQSALLRIPSQPFLRSFAPQGGALAPVFEPRVDPNRVESLALFGSTDAPRSVLWIARRSPAFRQCDGGSEDGRPCVEAEDCVGGACGPARCVGGGAAGDTCSGDADCPGGECGPALFDFRSRMLDGVGPIILPRFGAGVCQDSQSACAGDGDCAGSRCVTFRIAAAEPVPLEGVIESTTLLGLVVPEAIDDRDLNGDGDTRDDVMIVTHRRSGTRFAIGEAAAPGRAATRIHDAPFNYPAVASEGDLIAFLEAEPLQGRGDRNGDGDEFDTFLRVFRADRTSIAEVTAGASRAVDAAPAINGRNMVIENGLVWFRTREAAGAAQRIARVSVTTGGDEANGRSQYPALSADASQIGFESAAANLAVTPRGMTSYSHDRATGATTPVVVLAPNVSADAATLSPSLSVDGRYVAVSANDSEGMSQIFVVDRDTDADGIFDEPDGVASVQVSTTAFEPSSSGEGRSLLPQLTPNARYVAFLSDDGPVVNLFQPPLNVVVRDRDPDGDGVFESDSEEPGRLGTNDTASRAGDGLPPYGEPASLQAPAISADGRFVAFGHFEQNLPVLDVNNFCLNPGRSRTSCLDILLKDRHTRALDLISVSSAGEQSNNHSLSPAMSADGRFTAFFSGGNTLVAGDTNDASDVFVFDRLTQTTIRASVASDGTEGDASTFDRVVSVSADGRFVAFASTASNLVTGDENFVCDNDFDFVADDNCRDVFVHDRLTGFTRRVSVASDGGDANGQSGHPSLSADGATVAFESQADNLVAGDGNVLCDNDFDGQTDDNCQDIFVAEPDPADLAGDLNGDGDLDDTMLQVLESASGSVVTLGPATTAAVAGDCVAFLVPEAGAAPGRDLNGDGDTRDEVVHLYCHGDGSGVRNLERAATAVALSRERVAVLVSEAGQGGGDLNGDGDVGDNVVAIAPLTAPSEWANIGLAGDGLGLSGAYVAFGVPELAQGGDALNGDDDANDRVLYVLDARGAVIGIGQAVEDFVLSGARVAFRTGEAAQGQQDLSGDGTVAHAVMQVYDIDARRLVNTGQTAIPCHLSSCDPRFPYRVSEDTVRFLTLESQQGADLTGEGSSAELVLQVFNLHAGGGEGGGAGVDASGAVQTIGSVRAGVCADSGDACVSAAQCRDGRACLVPPGRCVLNLGTPCDLPAAFTSVSGLQRCGEGEFCVASGMAGKGRCHAARGLCDSDAQCEAPAFCENVGATYQRLAAPLGATREGEEIFIDAGRCIAHGDRTCDPGAPDTGCGFGERCAQAEGGNVCQREHGSCRGDADCPPGSRCRPELIVATAADSDGDGLADPFDNCARAANSDQTDADGNGVGDACQVSAATPTATPEAKPTPTHSPEPSTTRARGNESDDGCAIASGAPPPYGGMIVLLTGALLTWVLRWASRGSVHGGPVTQASTKARTPRRRIALVLLVALFPSAPASALCCGDCDGSGEVRINELVTLVGLALHDEAPDGCPAGDRNANDRISVDELVGSVGAGLRGCPIATVEDTAAAAVTLLRATSRMHSIVSAVAVAFDGAAGPQVCDLGGALGSLCQDVGPGLFRATVTSNECRDDLREGAVALVGQAVVRGLGRCPDTILPNGLIFAFDWDMNYEIDGALPVRVRQHLDVMVNGFMIGSPPCGVKGAAAVLDGDLTYLHGDEIDLQSGFEATRVTTSLNAFSESCDPAVVSNILDGPLTVGMPMVGNRRVVLSSDGLRALVDRDQGNFTLSGQLRGDCFSGTAQIATLEPFDAMLAERCFTRGALRIDSRAGTLIVRAASDGSVAIDTGADGSVDARFESCLESPQTCVMPVKGPAPSG